MRPALRHPAEIAEWLRARVRGDLSCDSRQVGAGDGFVAWPGAATDGRRFVATALAAGASAALVEQDGAEAFHFTDERVLPVPSLKTLSGAIASAFYGEPSSELDVVAFTGTNGKTSSSWWMAQLLTAVGRPCGLVGTLGIGRPPLAGEDRGTLVSTGMTTPDPVLLQRRLRGMAEEGLSACAMEASSIGMAEAFDEAGRLGETIFSPGDEYNGWLKWVAAHNQGGAVTFPTRAGQVAVQIGMDILAGKPVTRGIAVPSEYIAPADIGSLTAADRPDDWWATELPAEFLPQ